MSDIVGGLIKSVGPLKAPGYKKAPARNVLVYTIRGDFHAAVASHALTMRGNRVYSWVGQDYPEKSVSSISYSNEGVEVGVRASGECFRSSDIDVVWLRRRMNPVAPSFVDERDADFVTDELRVADLSHGILFDQAFWINNRMAGNMSDIKPFQLRVAQECGLRIPRTLISNDPVKIRAFVSEVRDCIFKPLGGYVWREGGRERRTYTAAVSAELLPDDRLLQASPGILQEKVRKSYEARVQFFGASYAGIKIESLGLSEGDLDWRLDQKSITACEPVVLPGHIYERCRKLMRRIGIVSGAFDFIVSEKGEWIFLEVNEAGQFMFIEFWCPQIPLLDSFCQFVESRDSEFQYKSTDSPLRLSDACSLAEKDGLIVRGAG